MKSPSLKDKRTEYPFSEKNWLVPPAFDQTPPSRVGPRPVAAVWAAAKDPSCPVPGALPPCFGAYLRSRALSPRWPRSADSQLLTNVCIWSRLPLRMRHCRAPRGTEPRRDFSRARGCAKLCPLSSTFSRSLADFVRKRSLNESPILGGALNPGNTTQHVLVPGLDPGNILGTELAVGSLAKQVAWRAPPPAVGEVPACHSSAMAEDVTGVVWVTRREKERCIRHAASLKFRGTRGAGAENVAQRATVRSPEAAQRCRRVRGGEWHRLGGLDRQLKVRVEVRGPRRPRFRDLRRLRLAGGLSRRPSARPAAGGRRSGKVGARLAGAP